MKEYICKIASIDEVITKWNYEIKKQKRKQKKSALELVKNNAVENIKNGQAVTYYGKLNDKIICQATAMFMKILFKTVTVLLELKLYIGVISVQIKNIKAKDIFQSFSNL